MLLAYQVGFDLYENEMQSFLQKVSALLHPAILLSLQGCNCVLDEVVCLQRVSACARLCSMRCSLLSFEQP